MKISTVEKQLTNEGNGRVLISTIHDGTEDAKLLVFLQTEGAAADGPYVIEAPGATADDIIVPVEVVREAVSVLAAVTD